MKHKNNSPPKGERFKFLKQLFYSKIKNSKQCQNKKRKQAKSKLQHT